MPSRPSGRRRIPPLGLAVVVLAVVVLAWLLLGRGGAPSESPPASAGSASAGGAPAAQAPAATAPSADAADARAADRYDLAADEVRGGHTLARHVGKSDSDLIDRLRRERGISAASTYTDRATAERVVAATIARHQSRVNVWIKRQGNRPNLTLDYRGPAGEPIGRSVRRGSSQALPCVDAVVVLRWDRARSFFVLTSYPEASR